MQNFSARVLSVVRRIPVGRVATYGDVATAAGSPGAARAVGNIMRTCGSRDLPAHRVIAAAGRLGGFGGNLELKRALLRAEGLIVTRTSIRDFRERRWPSVEKRRKGARRAPKQPKAETSGRNTGKVQSLPRASATTREPAPSERISARVEGSRAT
jgi:O-6-methylguanine DNA methyltransferase